jgi:hypothetical protein
MDFLNWLFSFDDSFDEELRGNPNAAKIASEIVLSKSDDNSFPSRLTSSPLM